MPSKITHPSNLDYDNIALWRDWLKEQWLELAEEEESAQKREKIFEKLWNDKKFRQSQYYKQLMLLNSHHQVQLNELQRSQLNKQVKDKIYKKIAQDGINHPEQATQQPELGGIFSVAKNSMNYNSEAYAQALFGYIMANNMAAVGLFFGTLLRESLEEHVESMNELEKQSFVVNVTKNIIATFENKALAKFNLAPQFNIYLPRDADYRMLKEAHWESIEADIDDVLEDIRVNCIGETPSVIESVVNKMISYHALTLQFQMKSSVEEKLHLALECIHNESLCDKDVESLIEQYQDLIGQTLDHQLINQLYSSNKKDLLSEFFTKLYVNRGYDDFKATGTLQSAALDQKLHVSLHQVLSNLTSLVPPPLSYVAHAQKLFTPVYKALTLAGGFWLGNMQSYLIGGAQPGQADDEQDIANVHRRQRLKKTQ